MIIAHFSDLHLLSFEGLGPRRLIGKRFTGWVNLKWRRQAHHKREIAQAVAREVRARKVDHVVITGDVTNLSLESEFELVRAFLEHDLGLAPDRVSLVPGNHDMYTRGAHRTRRFQRYLGEYITSDLPGATGVPGVDRFPYARLRGPAVIIGLSSAVPSPPLFASGVLGRPQRAALHALLAHDEVRQRTPVILQHHPWHNPIHPVKNLMTGLADALEQHRVLNDLRRGLLLHGHLHRRIYQRIDTACGHLDAIGTTSASLLDPAEDRMGGFNLYEIEADGSVGALSSFRLEPATGRFVPTALPSYPAETVPAA
jgi:3',5'-cyclic AMP phosphodiesterase CpdA